MKYRYFNSDMAYTEKWKEVETGDIVKFISEQVYEEYRIWDADNSGEDEVEYVVDDGTEIKFYKFTYSYWWTFGDEYNNLVDEVYYDVVKKVNFKYPAKDRDWIYVESYDFQIKRKYGRD